MNIYEQPWKLVQNKIRGAGGREIDKLRGVEPAVDTPDGSEAWIGSVTRVSNPPEDKPNYGCSEVYLPDGRRMFLFEAIELAPEEILGEKHMAKNGTGLGMLIKFLDAQKQYVLQCHPTREWAKKMWDCDYGKSESWYVIGTRDDTEEPAYILLGFKEGVTREEWEKYYYVDDLKSLENLCHKIEVKVGEAYFIGGGSPHALGEGCFVIEVQEPNDITLGARPYSVETAQFPEMYEGVSEELFNERLLGSYIYDGCTYEENLRRWRSERETIAEGDWGKEEIVIGPHHTTFFSFTEMTVTGEAPVRDTGFPHVGIALQGGGKLVFEGGELPFKQGDEIFFPYNIKDCRIVPDCGEIKFVVCHPEGVQY